MKKVVLVGLLIVVSLLLFTNIRLLIITNDINKINKQMDIYQNKIELVHEDINTINERITSNKKDNKDKWEEIEIWEKAEKKLETIVR